MSDDAPTRIFVKPAHEGAYIPDPAHPGLPLPAEGADVTLDHHWIARLRNGDVVEAETPSAEAKDDAKNKPLGIEEPAASKAD